jgi:hypothetical protein
MVESGDFDGQKLKIDIVAPSTRTFVDSVVA